MKKKTKKGWIIFLIVVLSLLLIPPVLQILVGMMYFIVDPIASLEYMAFAILFVIVLVVGIIYLSKKASK